MVAMPIDPYILSSELITGIFGTLKLTKKTIIVLVILSIYSISSIGSHMPTKQTW